MADSSSQQSASPKMKVLEASLDTIRLACSQPQAVTEIASDGVSVEVCPWVQQALERFALESDQNPTDAVVAQGVALMLRSELDLHRLHSPEDEVAGYAAQGELMLDAAVGSSLVREIQIEIDRLLAEGNAAESRQLSKFHHELRGVVHSLRRSIGESERARAASLAEEWSPDESTPAQADPARPLESTAAASPNPAKGDQPTPKQKSAPSPERARRSSRSYKVANSTRPGDKGNRVVTYAALALIALSAWGFWSHRQTAKRAQDAVIKASAQEELSSLSHVTRVQARKPFAVITVEDTFWANAGQTTKTGWLNDVASRSEESGFEGVVVRTAAGKPLAEWLKGGRFEIKKHPSPVRGG